MAVINLPFDPLSYSSIQLCTFLCSILLLYIVSVAIYRLYLSPLVKYPGPRLAALTTLYEFYYDYVKRGKYEWRIMDMHEKYGPIVRITPRELHIADPDFFETLFNQKLDRDAWVSIQFGNPFPTQATASSDLHRMRRAAVAPFFSQAKVVKLQSVVTDKIEQVCRKLQECQTNGVPANMYNLYRGMTVDIITQYAFLNSWKFLEKEDSGHEWFKTIMVVSEGSALMRQFRWIGPTMGLLPTWLAKALVPELKAMHVIDDIVDKDIHAIAKAGPNDLGSKNEYPTMIHELMYKSSLPPSEKSNFRLRSEAVSIVIAGSETTGFMLNFLNYHLISNPSILAKLKAELAEEIKDPWDVPQYQSLKRLPYLTACIEESLRISRNVPHRLARLAPKGGLRWRNFDIPEGTSVSMNVFSAHFDPAIFPQPNEFRPERWLEPDAKALKKYFSPFSKGPRICLGMELAYAELYLAVAMIHRRFDTELFETTREDVEIEHDFFTGYPSLTSKGLQITVK
ncbi:hypothetical protein MMC13_000277 [Lambiella insularis]|nr:hypothetical protein [Lambiella insularis]